MINLKTTQQRFTDTVRKACSTGDIQLFLQPKFDLRTDTIIGVEALMRWNTSDGQWLAPSKFLPHLRNSTVRFEITNYVVKEAIAIIEILRSNNVLVPVSVNLDPQEVLFGLTPNLEEAIHQPDVSPYFEIEITECEDLFQNQTLIRKIQSVRRKGIKVSLDDYGTGYSNYTALQSLEFDTLKMDKTFLPLNTHIKIECMRHAVEVAAVLGRELVVEGIETEQDKRRLTKMGVVYGQGYHLCRPIPLMEYIKRYTDTGNMKCA